MNKLLILVIVLLIPHVAYSAPEFSTSATQAVVMDHDTGKVLFEKSAYESMAPSSMTKLMTLYILFDNLESGKFSFSDELPVSEDAWRKGGSKMFVEVGKAVKIEDLIRGIIVQSGNDACIVVAEGISGTEESFADEMNLYADKLGLGGSHFRNSTGWPDDEHYMTSHDLAILTSALVRDFPQYYDYFAEKVFTYSGITQHNRNKLIGKNKEIDGLKTGHTEAGGYGIVVSGVEDTEYPRRTIVVVNGLGSEKERISEANKLYNQAVRTFEKVRFFSEGEIVTNVKVWFGEEDTIPVVAGDAIEKIFSKYNRNSLSVSLEYNEPITAPIKKGAEIANLHIMKPDEGSFTIPLYAGADVEELSAFSHFTRSISYRFSGD